MAQVGAVARMIALHDKAIGLHMWIVVPEVAGLGDIGLHAAQMRKPRFPRRGNVFTKVCSQLVGQCAVVGTSRHSAGKACIDREIVEFE